MLWMDISSSEYDIVRRVLLLFANCDQIYIRIGLLFWRRIFIFLLIMTSLEMFSR